MLAWPLVAMGAIYIAKMYSFENVVMWALGGLFGVGLSLSGMINNNTVLRFLTFDYDWDPSLAFVLGLSVLSFGATFW
tara:strand:- start:69 stop:302 length:234 start_codon:yes stop_codon:yes gene_type:complete